MTNRKKQNFFFFVLLKEKKNTVRTGHFDNDQYYQQQKWYNKIKWGQFDKRKENRTPAPEVGLVCFCKVTTTANILNFKLMKLDSTS